MLGEELGIRLEDWKVCLEEKEGQVVMRVTGRDIMENWIRSSPVKEVLLTYYGWQVITEKQDETYLLNLGNERLRSERGLWGNLRSTWSLLAERLPGKLRLFARLWEDPLWMCWDDLCDDRENLKEWSRKYRIEEDFQTLYLYTICLDKSRRRWGGAKKPGWRQERGNKSDFFLCLNEDRAYCFEGLRAEKGDMWPRWKYVSQEIGGKKPSPIQIRANYQCIDSLWEKYLVISYNMTERKRIELVKASSCLYLSEREEDEDDDTEVQKENQIPDCFSGGKLYICNEGEEALYISGIAGETKLLPGAMLPADIEESRNDDFCDR